MGDCVCAPVKIAEPVHEYEIGLEVDVAFNVVDCIQLSITGEVTLKLGGNPACCILAVKVVLHPFALKTPKVCVPTVTTVTV